MMSRLCGGAKLCTNFVPNSKRGVKLEQLAVGMKKMAVGSWEAAAKTDYCVNFSFC